MALYNFHLSFDTSRAATTTQEFVLYTKVPWRSCEVRRIRQFHYTSCCSLTTIATKYIALKHLCISLVDDIINGRGSLYLLFRPCRSSAVRSWLPTATARVRVRAACGLLVDKAALGQVFSEYFGFPCQSFHRFLHYHNHPGWHNRPLNGRSVEWTLIPPSYAKLKKKLPPLWYLKLTTFSTSQVNL
jgi:hypothetical protein